jgi:hypothetical protein
LDYYKHSHPKCCISQEGPCAWPARTPDLNALDYYFREKMQKLVYTQTTDDKNAILGKILDAATTPGFQ